MPTFTYQAKQGPTNIIGGTVEAQSQDEAVARLLRDGLVPVSLVMSADSVREAAKPGRFVRVRGRDMRLFTRQLTSLLRAKVELVPAVAMLKDQAPSKALGVLLEDLERQMRDGQSFSEALARHPRVFSSLFLSAIRAGEAAGKLDDILIKLVEFGDQQEQLESRLKGALAYPLLLGLVGLVCLGFFIWVVVPRMADLFAQLGGQLPWPTRVLLGVSHVLSHAWGWVVAGMVVGSIVLRWLSRQPAVGTAVQQVLLRLPLAGDVVRARQIGRFTRTLQLLLDSGLPVFQAMEVARPTVGSAVLEQRLREAQEHVKRGESIAGSLRAERCFPPLVTHMMAVGESAGTLVGVLDELASYYERFLDETLRILTSLLEPLMIVVMGVLVGFCVLAMILPIFQLNQMVR